MGDKPTLTPWRIWQLSRINHNSMAIQNMKDIAHCFSDLRRFIETKWPTIADLPSVEGVLLNGPENKHEVDALIAGLNRVADFYEGEQPTVELPKAIGAKSSWQDGPYFDRYQVIEALNKAGVKHDG